MTYIRVLLLLMVFFHANLGLAEEADAIKNLAWQSGPGVGKIGDKATIAIPKDYLFLDAAETKKFMELTHNIPSGNEYLFAPKDFAWWSIFEFKPVGYVKDDEAIDADSLLESVKNGTQAANEERKSRGWETMSVTGWKYKPQYEADTKHLAWAFMAKSDSTQTDIVNYNTRLLGRSGVMEVTLVADPAALDSAVAVLKQDLVAYDFVPGEKYAEFKQGDHVAEFGLAALVAGGAAAVAAKKGFFAVILGFLAAAWKLVLVAFVGIAAWFKSLFAKKQN